MAGKKGRPIEYDGQENIQEGDEEIRQENHKVNEEPYR